MRLQGDLKALTTVTRERDEARAWVKDLQSGMYINCVYCGHRYGPKENTPSSRADVLTAHIEQCPQHPMSALKTQLATVKAERDRLQEVNSINADLRDGLHRASKEHAALRTALAQPVTRWQGTSDYWRSAGACADDLDRLLAPQFEQPRAVPKAEPEQP